MTDTAFAPRLFADDAAIIRIGEGLLASALPSEDWTHEAHLAATCWLVSCRAEIDLESALPAIIRAYNLSVGGVNDDYHGYHETLTQLYLAGVRAHVEESPTSAPLFEQVNSLIESPRGTRGWPLHFYSKPRLFSVEARRYFVPPDRCAFVDAPAGWHCQPRTMPRAMEDLNHGHA